MSRKDPELSREDVFAGLRKLGVAMVHIPYQGGDDSGGIGGEPRLYDPSGHEIRKDYFGWCHLAGGDWTEETRDYRTRLWDALTNPIWTEYTSFCGEFHVHGELVWDTAKSKVYLCYERRNVDNPNPPEGCDFKDWYLPAETQTEEV